MDRLNLEWFDAMAAAGSQFSPYAQATGWPEFMRPNQIAALQRPGCDSASLCKAIESACANGALPSKKDTVKRHAELAKASIHKFLDSAYEVTVFRVNAGDLTAWLAASSLPPSEHILAWAAATAPAQKTAAAPAGTLMVWTEERKAEARAYRKKHGLKKTAEHYGVSQATISKHIPAKAAKQKRAGYDVFTHHLK